MTKVVGTIAPGKKISVYAAINPKQAFPVTVSTFEPHSRMVWSGGMPFGLFKGERVFVLTPEKGGTQFSMREAFTGLLAGLIGRSIPDLPPAFEDFAAALKRKAEQG